VTESTLLSKSATDCNCDCDSAVFCLLGDKGIGELVVVLVAARLKHAYLTELSNKLLFEDGLLSHSISIVFKI
jgi:hypothetical protein